MATLEFRNIPDSQQLDPFSQWIMDYGRDLDHAFVERLPTEGENFSLPEYFAWINEKAINGAVSDAAPEPIVLISSLSANTPLEPGGVVRSILSSLDGIDFDAAPITRFLPVPDEIISPALKNADPVNIDSGAARYATVAPFEGWEKPPGIDVESNPLVITAIIDDMVNLAHHQFRGREGKSRIDFAWVQDIEPDPGSSFVPIGREFQRTDIEAAIQKHEGDEDRILRDLGLIDFRSTGRETDYDPLAARVNHGTAVASVAAGMDPNTTDDENLERHRIITVAIPRRVTLDTTGYTLELPFIFALDYVLKRARDIHRAFASEVPDLAIPVVINFSYGVAGGPHDGRHIMELVARKLIRDHTEHPNGGQVALTLPSGNANLGRGHRRTANGGIPELRLPWRLQPGDQTPSVLEVWFPPETTSVELEIVSPTGDSLQLGDPFFDEIYKVSGRLIVKSEDTDTIVGMLATNQQAGSKKKRLIIILGPTEVPVKLLHRGLRVAERTVPSGIWQIKVTNADPLNDDSRIEAWILRDEAPLGTRVQARQSYFDDPEYERFTEYGDVKTQDDENPKPLTRRSGNINGIGTRPDPVNPGSIEPASDDPLFVAGAHLGKGGYLDRQGDRQEAGYSATAAPGMRQPDAAGESDHSRAIPGKIAAGTRGASLVSLNGTSVAAPQLARLIAGYYSDNPTSSPNQLRIQLKNNMFNSVKPNDAILDASRAGKGRPPREKYPRLPSENYPLSPKISR